MIHKTINPNDFIGSALVLQNLQNIPNSAL